METRNLLLAVRNIFWRNGRQSGSWPDRTSIQAKLPLENPLEREISPLDAPKEKRKPRQGRENLSGPVPLRKSGPMFRKAKAPSRCVPNRHPCKSFVKGKARSIWARSGERAVGLIGIYRPAHVCLSAVGSCSLAEPDIHLLPQAGKSHRRRLSLCSLPVPKQCEESLGSFLRRPGDLLHRFSPEIDMIQNLARGLLTPVIQDTLEERRVRSVRQRVSNLYRLLSAQQHGLEFGGFVWPL